jgi:hypothetical protein
MELSFMDLKTIEHKIKIIMSKDWAGYQKDYVNSAILSLP